jgi:hypothetical protein
LIIGGPVPNFDRAETRSNGIDFETQQNANASGVRGN